MPNGSPNGSPRASAEPAPGALTAVGLVTDDKGAVFALRSDGVLFRRVVNPSAGQASRPIPYLWRVETPELPGCTPLPTPASAGGVR